MEFPATVDVVTHENTKTNMEKMAPVAGLGQPGAAPPPNIFTQNMGVGLPKRTFTDRMTLGSGADQIDLHYFGRGHTNGDAWVVFPALRVVHAGDIFSGKNIPLLDTNNGGSRRRDRRHADESVHGAQQERGHDHHRAQHADDARTICVSTPSSTATS